MAKMSFYWNILNGDNPLRHVWFLMEGEPFNIQYTPWLAIQSYGHGFGEDGCPLKDWENVDHVNR